MSELYLLHFQFAKMESCGCIEREPAGSDFKSRVICNECDGQWSQICRSCLPPISKSSQFLMLSKEYVADTSSIKKCIDRVLDSCFIIHFLLCTLLLLFDNGQTERNSVRLGVFSKL